MYSLTITGHSKTWTHKSWKENLIHRSKIHEPAIEYFNGNKTYAYYAEQYLVKKTDDYIETLYIDTPGKPRHERGSILKHPAVVYKNGTKEWWRCGELHKTNGPAVVYPNGDCEYWVNGKRHRFDGPAVIMGNKQYWFIEGEFIKCIV